MRGDGWEQGPELTVDEALRRLAGQSDLLVLQNGATGLTTMSWGVTPRPLRCLADLPLPTAGRAEDDDPGGWPVVDGGLIVQLDYEFPVGVWDGRQPDGTERGRCWSLAGLVQWRAGRCRLRGDAATRQRLRQDLAAPARQPQAMLAGPLQAAWDRAGHCQRVERIRRAIAAGELYQANLTLPWTGRWAPGTVAPDVAVFQSLQAAAPGGYAALLRHAGRTVISHSPECFLAWQNGRIRSEPIKGTRRRRPGAEMATRAELCQAAKDNAELAMITDLVRNDLGRIARPGTVRVAQAAAVMDLPYVHHLYARIEAELAAGVDARAIFAAAFPPGSITGAPKIRAMQLLRQLEQGERGPYCGSIAWLGLDAGACSVAIRSLVVDHQGLRLDAGGGIVADSEGEDEWAEVLAKAAPMRRACGDRDFD